MERTQRPLSPNLSENERNYVFAVAMKYMKDEEAAADVAQDALLLAHRHRNSFRGDSRFSTWLYRIAATTALMHLRKRRRHAREVLMSARNDEEGSFLEERRSPSCGPDESCANTEAVEVVRKRLTKLGEHYKDIFWMRYFEGYTETEIADRLNLTLATVKTRAHRAKVAVREELRRELALAA